jgi:pyrroloquinoline quinone (PQQ) biosynthesis protein C
MNVVDLGESWSAYLHSSLIQTLDDTPFLTRCREGMITRDELSTFVRQQCHYSRHFTRYLSALLANLTDERDRYELVLNLFEEMGLGAFGNLPHSEIYRRMMGAMGLALEDEAPFAETLALVDTMLECASARRKMIGLGALCLGAEAIVPHVYSTVVRGFESIGEPRANLTFFLIHIEGDDEHAITMRRIIEREIQRDPWSRVDLEYGAARAIGARAAFFRALTERSTVRRLAVA